MDERLYRQLVAVIRKHSFQIKVEDEDGYHEFTSDTCEEGETVLVRCLTLRTDYAYGGYPRGHLWHIPLSDIHKEIRKISRTDTEFMWRARRRDLNRYDVEKIILGASHGIIRLNMV